MTIGSEDPHPPEPRPKRPCGCAKRSQLLEAVAMAASSWAATARITVLLAVSAFAVLAVCRFMEHADGLLAVFELLNPANRASVAGVIS
ncbi:hypothetical protein Actkin_00187 [Actinokineospora sp. UTMC 2448]|nr:hypothetical protein Actkin_00187 [Actinokineospora sp. UTMC 2448]